MKRLFVWSALALLLVFLPVSAADAGKGKLHVIFIGDSITIGALHKDKAKTAPPIIAAAQLQKMTDYDVDFWNCGRSGATTSDFLPVPHGRHHDFLKVEKAIKEAQAAGSGQIVFSVMLGTNDSACTRTTDAPVSNALFEVNLRTIFQRLRELAPGCIIVLHRPIWYSPNTYNSAMYLKEGLDRMNGYEPILHQLAAEYPDVYEGAFGESYAFFEKKHEKFCVAENGNAGTFYLHPNEKGAKKLAKFWARTIADVLATR